jgi:hypothetical protein
MIVSVSDKYKPKRAIMNVGKKSAIESSTGIMARKKSGKRFWYRKCDSCLDLGLDVAYCCCGHKYCTKCLQKMCKMALAGETPFPVACCGAEIRTAMNTLPEHSLQAYRSRLEELRATNYMHW